MKTLEDDPRLPTWTNRLLNSICVDTDNIETVCFGWGASEGDPDIPNLLNLYTEGSRSLFYNGIVFVRLVWPFGFFLQLKFLRNYRFQCGFGCKLNGRWALTFRWQSSDSAARGTLGPNYGQAPGWMRGTT